MTQRRWSAALFPGVAAVLLSATAAAQPPPGTLIEQAELQAVQGGTATLLGKASLASVIVFFRTDQDHSRATLRMMAECEKEMQDKPVHWVGVVSDSIPRVDVIKLIEETGLKSPVLIDKGDALYGALHIKLHPVVLLVGKDRKLHSVEPFRKVNYCAEVRAQLQRLMGEITQAQLDAVLNPEASTVGGDKSKGGRELKMAQKRLEIESWDKAIESAKKALALDPGLAGAQVVIGKALAKKGDCPGARAAYAEALKLDAKDPEAAKEPPGCEGK